MAIRTIPFGEWLPDQPDLANPGATLIRNALPAETSYRPWRAPGAITGPLDGYCRGAVAVKDTAGNTMGFAGDGTKLYRAENALWADASKPGGYAPQMEWDKASNQMTLELYIGANPALPVTLRPVDMFHDNPWPSG